MDFSLYLFHIYNCGPAFFIRLPSVRLGRRIDALDVRQHERIVLALPENFAVRSRVHPRATLERLSRRKGLNSLVRLLQPPSFDRLARDQHPLEIPRTIPLPPTRRSRERCRRRTHGGGIQVSDPVRHDNCALRADNGNQGGNDGKRERAHVAANSRGRLETSSHVVKVRARARTEGSSA